ncbi:MAG: hypothetical protein JOZ98_05415 [Solirubrobacterales bacterium]|nr:hypothetical protein [Solirubrobacterales bacterium]MBV9796645.1 hypothetical protein [Solirubrobacterales bacterium]
MEDPRQQDDVEQSEPPEVPPDTSDHPSHAEQIGGKGAEDPDEMADEERYRKGPGW